MSDDIALLFADELARPAAAARRIVFLSAMSLPQMQQYATGHWQVSAGPGFESAAGIDLAAVPATPASEDQVYDADVVSLEAPTWTKSATVVARWQPRVVKVNGAFHGDNALVGEHAARALAGSGYEIIGCHWRADNTYALRSLSRIDRLAAFGAPDWKHLNLIATKDADFIRTLLSVARLYVGEERRIADLRVSHAVRGDHIARLEDALMAHQRPRT